MVLAFKTIASLTGVDLRQAVKSRRQDPLFNEEIHIDEELINLEEAVKTYSVATSSLKEYPKMRRQLQIERRQVLEHCMGLIARMLQGLELPRPYEIADTHNAIKRIVRLLVDDALAHGFELNRRSIEVLRPLMSWRQRLAIIDWVQILYPLQASFSPISV